MPFLALALSAIMSVLGGADIIGGSPTTSPLPADVIGGSPTLSAPVQPDVIGGSPTLSTDSGSSPTNH